MRSFAFVAFDIDNSITDRFPLDYVTGLSGLGWKLKLSKLEGDVSDVITKVMQEKQTINLTVNLIGRGYEKFLILTQWLQKYSFPDKRLALEYSDGVNVRYTEGKVTDLKRTEKDEFNNLSCAAQFTPTTPFFSNIENTIRISYSSKGKFYPYKYPYCYGRSVVENNEIDNPYLAEIPVTVTIYGSITNPSVSLLNEDGEEYCTVRFKDFNMTDGQFLIINSVTKKIWFFDGNSFTDWTAYADPSEDTFLLAQSGKSKVSINLDASDTGYLVGAWRQYAL
ncbi:MAG: phage tail family protein [Clostridia bacterium]|nr:phage tail family protein [Clostridia bacterium]